jgi:hypothetical protein
LRQKQAGEAIKPLPEMPFSLLGRQLIYDGEDLSFGTIKLGKNLSCAVCS